MELLKGSVQRNTQAGITRLLLYRDGTFMQALEGDKATVTALFAKISRDPRHHQIIRLIGEPIGHRFFPTRRWPFGI
jgi:Sensors of blue-light using FAD